MGRPLRPVAFWIVRLSQEHENCEGVLEAVLFRRDRRKRDLGGLHFIPFRAGARAPGGMDAMDEQAISPNAGLQGACDGSNSPPWSRCVEPPWVCRYSGYRFGLPVCVRGQK